jgi:RecB family exonuclease
MPVSTPEGRIDDFSAPPSRPHAARRSASDWTADRSIARVDEVPAPSTRLFGIVLHRLFEAAPPRELTPAEADALARRVLRPDELAVIPDLDAFTARAAAAWTKARTRADVIAALDGDERYFEVPFSLRVTADSGPSIVRGTIDCLVRRSPGRFTVVEFKTGRPHDSHGRQLDLYLQAVRAMRLEDEGRPKVDGVLIYL